MKFKILLLLMIITFCSCETIDSGVIIKKEYHPAYTHLQPMLVGKTTMLHPIYHPEKYIIIIENNSLKRQVVVEKIVYDKYNIGDSIYLK